MKLDFFTSNGMVYRWSLVDGYPRCVEDALDPKAAGALPALQARAAIEVMTDAAEAYEAAQTIIARGEPDNGAPRQIPDPAAVRPEDAPEDWAAPLVQNPAWALLPRTIEAIGLGGEDGQETTAPEPRWQAFDAASAIVAAASPTTLALARWRAGEPSQTDADAHAAWVQAKADALAALETEAAKPLVVDPRPVPRVITSLSMLSVMKFTRSSMTRGAGGRSAGWAAWPARISSMLSSASGGGFAAGDSQARQTVSGFAS